MIEYNYYYYILFTQNKSAENKQIIRTENNIEATIFNYVPWTNQNF